MKLYLYILPILLIVAKTALSQDVSDIKITGNYENQPLKTVLNEIENQLDIKFTYMDKLIDNKFISTSFENTKLSEALNKILKNTNLSFKIPQDSGNIVLFKVQKIVIKAHVFDVSNNQSLPYTNIFIPGTYKGTITNRDGFFQLSVDSLPVKLKIQYIGYEIKIITISEISSNDLNISLNPEVIPMQAIVVTSEDPAVSLMKKVIEKKQEWQKRLKTYKAHVYSRIDIANDSGIVYISERISNIFWDDKIGFKEIVLSKHDTQNFSEENFDKDFNFCINFYNDEIINEGAKFIGPTHPDALKYYKFKIINQRAFGNKTIYDLSVSPTSKLQPTYTGQISILDEDFALLEVNLRPSNNFILPFPIQEFNGSFIQHYNNYGNGIWLPVDLVVDANVLVGFPGFQMPRFYYKNILSMRDYEINIPVPDSLYNDKKIIYDNLAIENWDSLFHKNSFIVPLESAEISAYQEIDSSFYFVDAFTPTGFIADLAIPEMREEAKRANNKKMKEKSAKISWLHVTPHLWYNRVDGVHFAMVNVYKISERIKLNFSGGYKTVLKKLTYGAGFSYAWLEDQKGWLGLDYYRGSDTRYKSELYTQTVASILPVFERGDYFDYYWNERVRTYINYRFKKINTNISLGLNFEKHKSLMGGTIKSLHGSSINQRINPPIDEGILRSFELKLHYGPKFTPFGIYGQKRLLLNFEYSHPDFISSSFLFTRWQLIIDYRLKTFLKRRALPNTFDFRLVAGTVTGNLPIQKYGSLDTGLGKFSSFGSFKTKQDNPYEGEKYFGFWGEHNFRTVPFELLGINIIAKRGIEFIIHGGFGRTWMSTNTFRNLTYNPQYQGRYHSEIGISINRLFYILRFDISYRIDKPGFYFTFSAPKIN